MTAVAPSDLNSLPPLPTTVVVSYSVPGWLERLKTDYYQRRISAKHLSEIHEVAIKAAVKDQELAGIDVVSDGELRRDNDIDYFLARIAGVSIPQQAKSDYFDYYEAEVPRPLPEAGPSLGLTADFAFTRSVSNRPVKFSFTGPFSLSRRIRASAYPDPAELVRDLARRLNHDARELARARARLLQIDEPFLAGYREQVDLAVEAVNLVTEGVDVTGALHVCYGNRYARPLSEGHYDFLFPAVLGARVDQLVLEFARKGLGDLRLLREHGWDRALGLGVIDVKSAAVESPDLVASPIRRALQYVPAGRLFVNPDCGLRHLAPDVARAKLAAMVAGAAQVRCELASPEQARAELAAPKLAAPAMAAPELVGAELVGAEQVGAEQVGAELVGAEQVGAEQAAPAPGTGSTAANGGQGGAGRGRAGAGARESRPEVGARRRRHGGGRRRPGTGESRDLPARSPAGAGLPCAAQLRCPGCAAQAALPRLRCPGCAAQAALPRLRCPGCAAQAALPNVRCPTCAGACAAVT